MEVRSTKQSIFDRMRANLKAASERLDKEIEAAGGEEAWRKSLANRKIEIPEPDPIRDRTIVSAAL